MIVSSPKVWADLSVKVEVTSELPALSSHHIHGPGFSLLAPPRPTLFSPHSGLDLSLSLLCMVL